MTITTDGEVLIYAVFDADGYECKSLVGLFSSDDKAEATASRLRNFADAAWKSQCERVRRFHVDNPRKIIVESWKLDNEPLPAIQA